jgi:hypothetical protein
MKGLAFIPPSGVIPIVKSFYRGKRVLSGTQKTAGVYFLKKDNLIGVRIVGHIFRELQGGHILARRLHIVQPLHNGHFALLKKFPQRMTFKPNHADVSIKFVIITLFLGKSGLNLPGA